MWDRDFLNKWDMGRRIEARLFCFGSGDSDDSSSDSGGSDNDSGGRQPGEGQVFGVNGVSKTGSTSQDAAIGYTDGSGGQGANYNALQNATSQQTTAAVAAANAAAAAGGDQLAQQSAVANVLENYNPSAVNQAGNLTQSGQDLVSQAANQAVGMQNTFGAGAGVAQALGMGPNAARVTPAEEAAMNALVGNNVQANAVGGVAPGGSYFADLSNPRALAPQFQAPINTIDTMLDTLARMEARDRQRRAMFGGQTAADVQALNAQAGEVYYDETTGTYKAGPLPDTRPEPIPSASYFADITAPRANVLDVASTNLPPATITDMSGTTFDTTTGEILPNQGDPFDVPQPGMERLDGPAIPTPPPPRYQTNAQRDFFEGLAAQGDNAMNAFQAELRNLDNRGFLGRQIAAGIGADGVPNYDMSFPEGSRIRGVTTTNFVDLPFMGTTPVSTYTGLNNPNAPADTSDDGSDNIVAPQTNPMTNQPRCPDGYIFDDDLQACRLDVSGGASQARTDDGDIFYRRTALDDAPANVPSGFDFNAANRRFTQSYGYRPDFYRSPMSLTGFTRLT
jgi:hypothetical protein